MQEVVVTRIEEFSASHRMNNPELSNAENERIYGPCGNPGGHGHNYRLVVSVKGKMDPKTGYLVDLKKLGTIIHERIIRDVDHKHLNLDVPWLDGVIPSLENLVVKFWSRLEGHLPDGRLHRVRLYESERSFADYYGPGSSSQDL
ncbi:6-carboxytetrahydropterin synthase [bacterium]|nr:6-carboxytetrahydropterin synthase [bacterium]